MIARDIAKQVEEELQYPGQIRITVVREIARDRVREVAGGSLVGRWSRRYLIRTFGCQMNEHDSERIGGRADGRRHDARPRTSARRG